MTIKKRLEVLQKQKEALVGYVEMCIFIKDVPKPEVLTLLKSNENVERLDECIEMFEKTKKEYTRLTSN